MIIEEQQHLREKTAGIMIDWAAERIPPFTGDSRDGFDDALTAAHVIADEARLSLHRWVDAARRSGLSWAEIGAVLGITKQAAQQRFGSAEPQTPDAHPDAVVIRLGATAFNEMAMLRREGLRGLELIGFGMLYLFFRPSPSTWEYRRVIALGPSEELAHEGWQHVGAWLPFQYYKRPLPGPA